jgi:two-component system nitrate/nitrite response regulator NarL
VRLVLCDNQQIFGDALAAALVAKGHHVLAVTTTPAAGVAAVAAHQPEVCVLGLVFPGEENGLAAARVICRHHPKTSVLLLSGVSDPQVLAEAVQVGVDGFISKAGEVDEVAAALDVIAGGGVVFDAGATGVARHRQPPPARNPLDALSPREKEVLAQIVAGNSTQLMARAMGITAGTVRMYVRGVLTKLGAHSRLQVAAMARQHAWLDLLTADDEPFTSAG